MSRKLSYKTIAMNHTAELVQAAFDRMTGDIKAEVDKSYIIVTVPLRPFDDCFAFRLIYDVDMSIKAKEGPVAFLDMTVKHGRIKEGLDIEVGSSPQQIADRIVRFVTQYNPQQPKKV